MHKSEKVESTTGNNSLVHSAVTLVTVAVPMYLVSTVPEYPSTEQVQAAEIPVMGRQAGEQANSQLFHLAAEAASRALPAHNASRASVVTDGKT